MSENAQRSRFGFRTYEYTLASGEQQDINVLGTSISCTAATGGFELAIDGGPTGEFRSGRIVRFSGQPFTKVTIKNASGASNTIKLEVALGEVTSTEASVSSITGGALSDSANVSILATTNAQVLAAAGSRREAFISNLDASQTVYLMNSNTAVARGVPLAPGATAILSTVSEIRAYNPGSGAVSLAVAEIT